MFFSPPPTGDAQQVSVSEVKSNLARTLEDAARGTATLVTRHGKTMAVVVSPHEYDALQGFRRTVARGYDRCMRMIDSFRSLDEGDERVPSGAVIALTESLVQELRQVLHVAPHRTVNTAGRGIDLYFFSPDREDYETPTRDITISVDEDGDACILFSDGEQHAAEELTRDTDAQSLTTRIHRFLEGDDDPETA